MTKRNQAKTMGTSSNKRKSKKNESAAKQKKSIKDDDINAQPQEGAVNRKQPKVAKNALISSTGSNSAKVTECTNSNSRKIKPSSLINIGATCYLNSAFQGISACDTFVRDINELCKEYNDSYVKQLPVFRQLIAILNGCQQRSMDISRNSIFQRWNKAGQQDSYELLAYAMNEVYNELRKYKEDKGDIQKRDLGRWLKERLPMRLILQYRIECGCKTVSYSPIQSDLALHLNISKSRNSCHLHDLIERYFAKDPIEDYQCDNSCGKEKNTVRLATLFTPLPRTVCIHLQRTYWNGYKMVKIDTNVRFEQHITLKSKYVSAETNADVIPLAESPSEEDESSDISDFCYSKAVSAKKINRSVVHKESSTSEERKKTDDGEKYALASVIVHYGSVSSGHYICYKRVGHIWFLTDDTSVREVASHDVFNCEAYILFYEQI